MGAGLLVLPAGRCRRRLAASGRVFKIVVVLIMALVWLPSAPAAAMTGRASGFHPFGPVRLLDTRSDESGPLGPGSIRVVAVGPLVGIDAEAVSVVLNIAVTEPSRASFLTVWPTGQPRPGTSNLTMVPEQTVANLVMVGLGDGGSVSIFNLSGTTHLVVDYQGSFDGVTTPIFPQRIVDTRLGIGGGRLGEGEERAVTIAGTLGIPGFAPEVALNITVTNPSAAGYLTVWPADTPRPSTSALNMAAGQTVANAALVQLSTTTSGTFSVLNAIGSTDLIIDAMAWGGVNLQRYQDRLLDTRTSQDTGGALGPGETRTVPVSVPSVPDYYGVRAISIHVTATNSTAPTFLTVWPAGQPQPPTANVNLAPGQTVGNLALVGVGNMYEGSAVNVFNLAGQVDVVIDITGWQPELHRFL